MASREEVERIDREREDMEATLHEVASDLGRLALLYRTQVHTTVSSLHVAGGSLRLELLPCRCTDLLVSVASSF